MVPGELITKAAVGKVASTGFAGNWVFLDRALNAASSLEANTERGESESIRKKGKTKQTPQTVQQESFENHPAEDYKGASVSEPGGGTCLGSAGALLEALPTTGGHSQPGRAAQQRHWRKQLPFYSSLIGFDHIW